MRVVLLAVLAAVVVAQDGFFTEGPAEKPVVVTTKSCTLSGDPHYVTLDGAKHDFQGKGVYQIHANDYFEVQSHLKACGGGAVSCVVDGRVKVIGQNGAASEVITHGNSGVTTLNGVTIVKANLAAAKNYKTPNGIKLSLTGNKLTISGEVTADNDGKKFVAGWSVAISTSFLGVTVPVYDGFIGGNGLCGLFNGFANDEFTHHASFNPTGPAFKSVAGARYNGAAVNTWGATFAVKAGGPIVSLSNSYIHTRLNAEGKHEDFISQEIPVDTQPDATEQAALDNVQFKGLAHMGEMRAKCASLANVDADAYDNCMYDAAAMDDFSIAESNIEAVNHKMEMERQAAIAQAEKDSTDQTLAIVFGILGGVALIAAAVLLYKHRGIKSEIKTEMTRALVRKENAGSSMQV